MPAQSAYYQLTIGENETATELTITASIEGKGSGSKTVSLVYLDTLKIGDALSDIWNYIYINSNSSAEKTYNLALVDYWGNAVNGVTYELSGAWGEGTKVEGNTLTLAVGEEAYPMYLSATVDGVTTDYEVYVTAVDDTDAPTVSMEMTGYIPKVTISNLNDADFPLTLKAYARTGGETDDTAIFEENPYNVIVFNLAEDGVTTENATMFDIVYADGSLSAIYNASSDGLVVYSEERGNKYYGLKLVAVDASENPSAEAIANWHEAQGCFVAGTQVQTVNGLVNIEDIKLGDMVYSIDLTTGAKVVSPVTWVQGTRYTDATYTIYVGSEKIVTTYEHPFYVIGKEWVAAEDLVVGDVIKTVDGQVTITNIVYTQLDTPMQVYNFTVDGTHNYLISESGLLVHNITKD